MKIIASMSLVTLLAVWVWAQQRSTGPTPATVQMVSVADQAASVHAKEAEFFYVIDGAGTLVTGGVTKQIKKGGFILVPEGVPHHFPKVEGNLTLMSLHLPRTQ